MTHRSRAILVSLVIITVMALTTSRSTWSQPSSGIEGVLAPGTELELIKEEFSRLEGPVGAPDGSLYFSDRNPDRTYHLDLNGNISVFRENTDGANGLAFTRQGEMIVAEGSGNKISKIDRGGKAVTLADGYGGKPFLYLNDLIVDEKGGVYFTDPGYAIVGSGAKTLDGRTRVFYLPPSTSQAIVIDEKISRPNGLTLTLDGKVLIVNDTVDRNVIAFDIQPDGTVRNRRVFAELQGFAAGQPSGADGMAIDNAGRIYVATLTGVQVFGSSGNYLGEIKVPRRIASLAFAGPDKRTLYLVGGPALFRLKMLSQGPDRIGK